MNSSSTYDPEHPWFQDEKDDPSKANWLFEFALPTGETRQPVFLRGQMLLAIVRTLVFIAALATAGGNPWAGAGLGFLGLTLLLIASMNSHSRRLNDAGKPGFLAMLIALPLIIAMGMMVMGAQSIPDRLAKAQAEREQSRSSITSAIAPVTDALDSEQTTASENAAAAADDTTAEIDSEALAEQPVAQETPAARPRGPQAPLTEQSMLSETVQSSLMIWFVLSLISMFFTLFYVARAKTVARDQPANRYVQPGSDFPRNRSEFDY